MESTDAAHSMKATSTERWAQCCSKKVWKCALSKQAGSAGIVLFSETIGWTGQKKHFGKRPMPRTFMTNAALLLSSRELFPARDYVSGDFHSEEFIQFLLQVVSMRLY